MLMFSRALPGTFAALALAAGLALSAPIAFAQQQPQATPPAEQPAQPEAAPSPDDTPETAEAADISGAEEFIRYCAVCHGVEGKGDGPLASMLKKEPADLTKIAARNQGHYPFSKVAGIIRDGGGVAGHGSSDMPAWGEVFRDHVDPIFARALIFELALYIEGMQAK